MWKPNIKLRQNFLQFPKKELRLQNDARRNDQQLCPKQLLLCAIFLKIKGQIPLAIYSVRCVLLISGIMSGGYGSAL
jgi:hypothetical protein